MLVLLLAVARGMAGEAIIVGKEGSKTDAIKESKFGKELSRPWEKVSPDSPLNGFFPSLPRMNPIDPKADRKRKLDDREKKNWMTVLPGELQSEEEKKNFLGVREYEIEKEEDTDNLMFREMRAEKNGSQTTSKNQNRTSTQKDNQQNAPPRTDTSDLERELASYRAARQDNARMESKYGSHTASELNFKGIFGPAPSEAGQEMSLRDMLGSGQQVDKNQQALRDEFKAFLSGNAGNPTAPVGGLADPINSWRRDFTRQPLVPAMTKPAEEAPRNDTFSTFNAPRQGNGFAAGAFGNSYQPSTPAVPPPVNSTPAASGPLPMNRFGMNSLGGHR